MGFPMYHTILQRISPVLVTVALTGTVFSATPESWNMNQRYTKNVYTEWAESTLVFSGTTKEQWSVTPHSGLDTVLDNSSTIKYLFHGITAVPVEATNNSNDITVQSIDSVPMNKYYGTDTRSDTIVDSIAYTFTNDTL